ncbi:MAG: ankyrin repeat domain-containing protein [Armatimonadetes bacterium]|nr:ankyrin repeat domain-containing protein [Armatimonadota bacterium]
MNLDQWLESARDYWAEPFQGDPGDDPRYWCAVADLDRVKALVQSIEPFGESGWGPIHYLCFSKCEKKDPADALKYLLELGADPNAFYIHPNGLDEPLSVLYGASGVLHDPEMTKILLDAGANPDDGESIYHSCEAVSEDCMRVLLEGGAKNEKTNGIKHGADFPNPKLIHLMVEHGADPNENVGGEPIIHHVIRHYRDWDYLEPLFRAGVDTSVRSQEGYSVGRHLVRRGAMETLTNVEDQLDMSDVTEHDRQIGRAMAGEKVSPVTWSFLDQTLVPALAQEGRIDRLKSVFASGCPVNAKGGWGETALHWASWGAQVECVQFLIESGADLNVQERNFKATPIQWACHNGLTVARDRTRNVQVIRLLREAGAEMPSEWAKGNSQIDAAMTD